MAIPTISVSVDQSADPLQQIAARLITLPRDARKLVLGGDPDASYTLPERELFRDEEGRTLDFAPAPDIEELSEALIAAHPARFEALEDLRIRYLWAREGGSAGGNNTWGKCIRASGMVRYWADCDVIIWLAYDHLYSEGVTNWQVEALTFHELLHITFDDKGKLTLRGHQWEGFVAEIVHYGLWQRGLQAVGAAVQQALPLADGGR